jgi:hypothetical protein
MIKFSGDLSRDFDKATAEILKLKDRILGYQEQISSLREKEKHLRKTNAAQKEKYEEALTEKDAIIKELQNRLAHAEALLGHDGTNTGTPTDQTPPGKNKVIPNTRRSAISKYMRIDWRTVGRCIARVHEDLEPDVNVRLDGAVKIGIDETSYRKGHSYITVVVNHETNTVIWAAKDHGKSVLQKFCEQLTPEQRASIKVVTGDGARWITDCVKKYFPNAERCVDPFHVVEWATEALDKVRVAAWRRAQEAAKAVAVSRGKGRPRAVDLPDR